MIHDGLYLVQQYVDVQKFRAGSRTATAAVQGAYDVCVWVCAPHDAVAAANRHAGYPVSVLIFHPIVARCLV